METWVAEDHQELEVSLGEFSVVVKDDRGEGADGFFLPCQRDADQRGDLPVPILIFQKIGEIPGLPQEERPLLPQGLAGHLPLLKQAHLFMEGVRGESELGFEDPAFLFQEEDGGAMGLQAVQSFSPDHLQDGREVPMVVDGRADLGQRHHLFHAAPRPFQLDLMDQDLPPLFSKLSFLGKYIIAEHQQQDGRR